MAFESVNDCDFRKIYDYTARTLLRISFKIVGSDEIAEDMVHDAFIKMREKSMGFSTLDDAKYWLIRVVHNASLNYVGRKRRERASYERFLSNASKSFDSAESEFMNEEKRKCVLASFRRLSEKYRAVLFFREYAELSYKEIARIIGISEGNVKIRIFRAREQFAKFIGEDDDFMS